MSRYEISFFKSNISSKNLLQLFHLALRCNYFQHWYWGYSCEFDSIEYLDEGADIFIDGEHEVGFGDQDIVTVFNSFSNMSFIPPKILLVFDNVKNLLLSQSRMQSIDGAFQNCDKIEVMTFYRNQLTRIQPKAFVACSNLQDLDLGSNQIETLPVDAFDGLGKLEYLVIDNNPIKVLESHIFDQLVNLQFMYSLDLDITDFDRELFKSFKNVQRFHFGSKLPQSYAKLESGTFKSLTALEALEFKMNAEVMEIEPAAFEDLENLQRLVLAGNKIKRLSSNLFVNVSKLTWLDIRNNELSEVERSFFTGFSKLKEVLANENLCVNKNYYFETPSDEDFVTEFEECFSNYESTVTTETSTEASTTTASVSSSTESSSTTSEKPMETTSGSSSISSRLLNFTILCALCSLLNKIKRN